MGARPEPRRVARAWEPPSAAARRQARAWGLAGFVTAAALPVVLWHRAIGLVATDFRFEFEYLITGWTGYVLMLLGLAFLVPVLVSIGRRPGSRFYPRSRNAYLGWGISLYLLGFILAAQVATIAREPYS
jgi:hypothetical protein